MPQCERKVQQLKTTSTDSIKFTSAPDKMLQVEDSSSHRNRLSDQEIISLAGVETDSGSLKFSWKNFSQETLGHWGTYKLLTIETCASNESKAQTLTFFVKMTKRGDSPLVFDKEAKFHHDLAPLMLQNYRSEPWAPKCFLARDDLLVMEDLKSQGFKIVSNPLSIEQMRSAVATIARLHSCSILLVSDIDKLLSRLDQTFLEGGTWESMDSSRALWLKVGMRTTEYIASELSLDSDCISKAYDMDLEKLEPKDGEPNALSHRDLWPNNIMFREKNGKTDCRLVDFQLSTFTSYVVDLLEFIYINADKSTREIYETELIIHYHEKLMEQLKRHDYQGKEIPLEKVQRDYDDKKVCGLVGAVQCLPISLLNKELSSEFSKPGNFEYHSRVDRTEFVKKVMRVDESYRRRIEGAVRDLVEYMQDRV
ncbi:hypothetical protein QAD02_010528 [Eretmocerus hayati]|uniref:Uncharacterized protein n=1 Tax=Eretmocerus hayati TaxID=131215 RepID=A0ACC2NX00_9HYME|nr:hypothetical protein QAD02_010528 [Eretmocerus hayati]